MSRDLRNSSQQSGPCSEEDPSSATGVTGSVLIADDELISLQK